jgi:hypothetical protein
MDMSPKAVAARARKNKAAAADRQANPEKYRTYWMASYAKSSVKRIADAKIRYTKNKEHLQEMARRRWRRLKENEPVRVLVKRALYRQYGPKSDTAELRELLVRDLSPPPTHCPVLGIELIYGGGEGTAHHPDCASIDKIIPAHGYRPGNVAIISSRANTLKRDATVDEIEALAKWLRDKENDPWRNLL